MPANITLYRAARLYWACDLLDQATQNLRHARDVLDLVHDRAPPIAISNAGYETAKTLKILRDHVAELLRTQSIPPP